MTQDGGGISRYCVLGCRHPSRFKRASRKTKAVVRELTYSHGVHPALVPGVSIEDQRVRYGTDRLVFGAYEPMTYYLSPPPGTVAPETREAMHTALAQTTYHWGLNAWAMYAPVGGAVAYGAYRRGRVLLMSSILEPLFGARHARGAAGQVIDIFATVATLFGTTVSLGIGALQIGRGVEIVAGIGPLGNSAMLYQLKGTADVGGADSPQDMLFTLLDALPGTAFVSVIAMLMLAIFFITSANSGSLVMGMLSQRGKSEPDTLVVVFWGLLLAGIAIVMLLVGGNEALQGLQNLIIVSALPFTLVLFMMLFSFWKDLQTDPIMLRYRYGEEALNQAGAGADFDSSDPAYTSWYQRRDEDGQEIEYDYRTGPPATAAPATGTARPHRRPTDRRPEDQEEQEDYARS